MHCLYKKLGHLLTTKKKTHQKDRQPAHRSQTAKKNQIFVVCGHDLWCTLGGVASLRLRVVCEKKLENKVLAAQSVAGRESPLRPGGDLGGNERCKPPPTGVSGQCPGKF